VRESKKENIYDFELKDLFLIMANFKWLIIFMVMLFLILSSVYLYFKPSIYSSYSIIEVKTRDKNIKVTDDLLQNAFYSTNKAIEKEMEILRTYEANRDVIKRLNFIVQFYVKKDYKKAELYGDNIPIEITKLKVFNDKIIGKMIKVIFKDNGYSLNIVNSKKNLLLKEVFHNMDLLELDENIVYPYNKVIKTDYFKFSLNKIRDINETIYLKINGNYRNIYEMIVKDKLKITQLNQDAPLIKISYEDTIPTRAVNYVNNLVTTFLESEERRKYKKSDKILTFLKNQLKSTREKLLLSEKELERYKVRNHIIDPSLQSNIIIRKLSDIEIAISDNKLKNMLLDNALAIIKSKSDFNSIGSFLSGIDDDRVVSQLNSLHKLRLKEISLSSEFTDEYPELIDIREQISTIKSNIVSNIKSLKSSVDYKLSELRKSKREYENNLLNLPKKEIVLANLIRKHEINSQMYDYLLKKKSEKEIIKVAISSDYKIIEKGYIPKKPIKPKRSLIMLLSLILGLLAGIFLAIVFHKSNKKIKTIEDIEAVSKLPIYGVIPFIKKSKNRTIEVFERAHSAFADSYRVLRANLQLLSAKDSSNVILFTSIMEKEGKSISTVNLSAILQLAGYRVIVIDLNLYNPVLHKYFDINFDVGISGYLNGKDNLSDIIFSTAYPNLDIIPVGAIPINPSELLISNRIEKLLEKLRERYDYILIDTASLTVSIDTLYLMQQADINLVVLKDNITKKIHIDKLHNMISKYHLKNIGLILNGVGLKYLNNINNKF